MSVYDTLKSLNIELPPVAVPAAAYVPFVQTGNLVFLSGHIAKKDGKVWAGQLGKNISTAEGQQAARAVAIDLMGTLHAAVGDLNKVKRIVKVMSLVNSTGDFTEQHLVTNGCSELLGQVFGPQAGAHARSAFGVAQIPMGACAIASIERYFEVNFEQKIGNISAGALLGFVLEEIGPSIYNRAVSDAKERMLRRVEDLEYEIREDEFQYWQKFNKRKA
eukprot:gene3672-3589_t